MLVLLLSLSVSVRGDSVNCGIDVGLDGCDTSGLVTIVDDQLMGKSTIDAQGNDITCVGQYPDGCNNFEINGANSLLCPDKGACVESKISSPMSMSTATVFHVTCSGDYSCYNAWINANYATAIMCSGENSCDEAIFDAKAGQHLTVTFVGSVSTRSDVGCLASGSSCSVQCRGDACANVIVWVTDETEGSVSIECAGAACPYVHVDNQKSVPVPVEWLYVISALSLILFVMNGAWCFVGKKGRKYAAVKVYDVDSEDQNQHIVIAQ